MFDKLRVGELLSHMDDSSEITEIDARFRASVPPLDSKSPPPSFSNGKPRLYISLTCPYAQRVWIARNFKGLENTIEVIPINLADKPSWYMEKISATAKVPALEHNGKVKVESLELLQYLDNTFPGPRIFPLGPAQREATRELLRNTEPLNQKAFVALKGKDARKSYLDKCVGLSFDHLEAALGNFSNEGPYFLGHISGVDFAYVPFIERFNILFLELLNYNILENRPRLTRWLMEINQVDAYTSTKANPRVILNDMRRNLGK